MKNVPYVIVGNALSAMVAATELAKTGHEVVLVNGTKNWGGHFTKFTFDGVSYDAGMVLHEFTAYNAQSDEDLETYDSTVRNDPGRFCNTVRSYINRFQTTHAVSDIKMYVAGEIYDDMLIANALTSLTHLPFASVVKQELADITEGVKASVLHASNKHTASAYRSYDYESVSIANHGDTLHQNLFEPFCKKLLNSQSDAVNAFYHRVPWVPLFYPETLLSYLNGSPQALPPTVFSYPTNGYIGDLANTLKDEIQKSKLIEVVNEHPTALAILPNGQYELSFGTNEKILANDMAWSSSPSDLLKLSGEVADEQSYEKASFTLVFTTALASHVKLDFSVLSIVDADKMIYRITNQTHCAASQEENTRMVVEINTDYMMDHNGSLDNDAVQALVRDELMELGVVSDPDSVNIIKVINLKNALPLPSVQNIALFDKAIKAVKERLPHMLLLGASGGFSSSSINHQILQGLKLVKTWGK